MDSDEYYVEHEEEEEPIEYDLDEIALEPPVTFMRLKSQVLNILSNNLIPKSSMIFFRLDEIKRILDKKVEELVELLDITYDESLILFHFFHWNRDKLENSDWFTNQHEISRRAGLITLDERLVHTEGNDCPVCMAECSEDELDSLKCGHRICKNCWDTFVNGNVELKENNFFWKCPGQTDGKNCALVVPDSFNRKYLRKDNETKYTKKLCNSYVEENRAVRWCPAPNCIYCVENPSLTSRTIKCKCLTIFCFRCGLEDHHPVSCELAGNWKSKNAQESENTKWVNVYTKACPKCRMPIEKNQGCNHMTCKHKGCNFEFCWLCLDEWKAHQGSHYKCNKFESLNEEEKSDKNSQYNNERAELEKYVFYFERFSNNERATKIAKDIHAKMEQNVNELYSKLALPFREINFLTDASENLQKTRKIMKWTYSFAYYIKDQGTKDLFEFHQKDLERYCEELNETLEMNYSKAIQVNQGVLDLKTFLTYKDKVTNASLKCQKFSTEMCKVIDESLSKGL